jgi:hypothetical protein
MSEERKLQNLDSCPNCHVGEINFDGNGNLVCSGAYGQSGCGLVVKQHAEPATEEEPGDNAKEPV